MDLLPDRGEGTLRDSQSSSRLWKTGASLHGLLGLGSLEVHGENERQEWSGGALSSGAG